MAVKDSGKRQEFAGGMVRDVTEGKIDYSLVFDGPMFERWAAHLTEGAKKYQARNWLLACDVETRERFRSSAVRHFVQWLRGDDDEDHAAAVFFNLNGHAYVADRLSHPVPVSPPVDDSPLCKCGCGLTEKRIAEIFVEPRQEWPPNWTEML